MGKEQRIYITLRTDSPHFRLPEEGLSQPLSTCTDGSYTDGQQVVQYMYTADRAERGWESASHRRRRGELSVLRVIYIYSLAWNIKPISVKITKWCFFYKLIRV